jgi:hypothetical protein
VLNIPNFKEFFIHFDLKHEFRHPSSRILYVFADALTSYGDCVTAEANAFLASVTKSMNSLKQE